MSVLIIDVEGVRTIKFNNPSKKNAITTEGYIIITEALNSANTDDTIKIVVLTGTGDFYSSGNEFKLDMVGNIATTMLESKDRLTKFVRAFYTFTKPLIALVNGPCIGVACTTAALCDVIYASENAYFHTPFTNLGICAEGCSSYTFPKILGHSKAMEMLLFCHKLSAQEAYQFNFVSEVFKLDELDTKIWPRIKNFAKLPPGSLKVNKALVNKFNVSRLELVNFHEMEELNKRWFTEEAMEAIVKMMNRKSKL